MKIIVTAKTARQLTIIEQVYTQRRWRCQAQQTTRLFTLLAVKIEIIAMTRFKAVRHAKKLWLAARDRIKLHINIMWRSRQRQKVLRAKVRHRRLKAQDRITFAMLGWLTTFGIEQLHTV